MAASETSAQQETNAALAKLAAGGNNYALGQLWEINKGLLRSMFWKWYPAHKAVADAHGMTADDFEQEGFFAVQNAAQTYDPARGAFTTWLTAAMQRQINKSLCNGHRRNITDTDGHQHTISADPLNHCTSLDLPLEDDDNGSATLKDLQEDKTAAGELEAVENAVFREELAAAIDEALNRLTEREADVIRRRYYQRQTWAEIESALDLRNSQGRAVEHKALNKLRRNPALNRFHDEIISSQAYSGTGFASWTRTGSIEERLIEYLESKGTYTITKVR